MSTVKNIFDYPSIPYLDSKNRPILNVENFYEYTDGRRFENTTRKIDATIQLIFKGYKVRFISNHFHYEKEKLFFRLMYEHSFNKESENRMRKGNDLIIRCSENMFWLEFSNKD